MIKNAIASGMILPIIVILAVFFNLKAFLYSSNLSLFEVLVSVVYLAIWILEFKFFLRNKKHIQIFFSTILWLLTCLASTVTLYAIISDAIVTFHLIFSIFFITPIYGLKLIYNHKYMLLILVTIISCCFSYYGVKFLITQRKE